MLDSARHFLAVDTIKTTLDVMAAAKLNVLHWHLPDAQSFPIAIAGQPELAAGGAYRVGARSYVYSADDVKGIVRYAADRAIRIVPEFDVPGHAAGWHGVDGIVVQCPVAVSNINNAALDPTLEATYTALGAVLDAVDALFPDAFVHLGGDEFVHKCWDQMAHIHSFMQDNGIASIDELYVYFHDRLEALLADHPRLTAVYWQEAWETLDLPADAVIQFWSSKGEMPTAAAEGHPVLLSAGWYLDQQVPSLSRATHYEWMDTWLDMYDNEPSDGFPYDDSRHNLYGGEVTMWSEQVDDLSIHGRIWPRAAAVAERLWSRDFDDSDTTLLKGRFDAFSCNLKRWYGIGSSPLVPGVPCAGAFPL
eukprot:gnl/Ergobibamus_cyprinoides/666.p2 GENE.gnl/Ergobibamus_cyprinoides/666~~gnl/Ergobibamus_cyprinoides/666.p2  ORF type:complete len:363 (+),score=144.18 gnl/Ergobibamus_cyprinoides/666:538-1626(+)